jgi:hypothetical protein
VSWRSKIYIFHGLLIKVHCDASRYIWIGTPTCKADMQTINMLLKSRKLGQTWCSVLLQGHSWCWRLRHGNTELSLKSNIYWLIKYVHIKTQKICWASYCPTAAVQILNKSSQKWRLHCQLMTCIWCWAVSILE